MVSKEWKEHTERTEHARNRAQIKQAEASRQQAAATERIANEQKAQTAIMAKTEALKQEQLQKQQKLDNQISNLKSVLADLAFRISDVEIAEGVDKIKKFLEIDDEFNSNASYYRAGLVNTGQTTLVEELVNHKKRLDNIKKSIETNPKLSNQLKCLKHTKSVENLSETKEKLDKYILNADNLIIEYNNSKNKFMEDYCEINKIDSEKYNKLLTDNRLNFSKPGFFNIILLVRRLLLLLGSIMTAGFLINPLSGKSFDNADITLIAVFGISTLFIFMFVGRKTLKKRKEINKLEVDYNLLKQGEDDNKATIEKLNSDKQELKNLNSELAGINKELINLKKKDPTLENL